MTSQLYLHIYITKHTYLVNMYINNAEKYFPSTNLKTEIVQAELNFSTKNNTPMATYYNPAHRTSSNDK